MVNIINKFFSEIYIKVLKFVDRGSIWVVVSEALKIQMSVRITFVLFHQK